MVREYFDGRADELIQKYTSETWLTSTKTAAGLTASAIIRLMKLGWEKSWRNWQKKEPLLVEKVLEKLAAANRTADATQVGRAMVNQMSDEQLVSFAQTKRGQVLLNKINHQVTEQSKIDEQSGSYGKDETAIKAN
ncbi:MAG TPA: hypothetical protein VNI60_09395 [Pyrinomonadaceae bacterium]|nr:hypothetical protein [Pyrinomonadaceae bacterium]